MSWYFEKGVKLEANRLFWPLLTVVVTAFVTWLAAFGRWQFERGDKPTELRKIVNCADNVRVLQLSRFGGTLLFSILMLMEMSDVFAALLGGWRGAVLAVVIIAICAAVLWAALGLFAAIVSERKYQELRNQLSSDPGALYVNLRRHF